MPARDGSIIPVFADLALNCLPFDVQVGPGHVDDVIDGGRVLGFSDNK
jgi:hypothetical protein